MRAIETLVEEGSPRAKKRVRQNAWVKQARKSVALEKTVEEQSVAELERMGCIVLKFGRDGWPDRLVIYAPGRHVWMEFKRAKFGHLTPAQKRRIPKLQKANEWVEVVTSVERAVAVVKAGREHVEEQGG